MSFVACLWQQGEAVAEQPFEDCEAALKYARLAVSLFQVGCTVERVTNPADDRELVASFGDCDASAYRD